MTSLGLVSSELEAQTSPWVCFISDSRLTFLALRNEASQGDIQEQDTAAGQVVSLSRITEGETSPTK